MIVQGTSVGLDVHALSVVAHAVDEETGKIARARLCPDHGEVLGWLHQLRAPVRVTYEAGPTGFGLARAITEAGMECVVAAPSKLQRPAGDRIKTDARDAAHLARLLRLGEITAVTVPDREIVAHGFFAPDALPNETTASTRARIFEVLNGAPVSERW